MKPKLKSSGDYLFDLIRRINICRICDRRQTTGKSETCSRLGRPILDVCAADPLRMCDVSATGGGKSAEPPSRPPAAKAISPERTFCQADADRALQRIGTCRDCTSFECRKTPAEKQEPLPDAVSVRYALAWVLYTAGIAEPKCRDMRGCVNDFAGRLFGGKCEKWAGLEAGT